MDVAKALGPENLMALKEMGTVGEGLGSAFRLPSGFTHEQDARMNGGSLSDDDGEGSTGTENVGGSSDDDLDADYDPAYVSAPKCINCTAPLFMDAICSVSPCCISLFQLIHPFYPYRMLACVQYIGHGLQ